MIHFPLLAPLPLCSVPSPVPLSSPLSSSGRRNRERGGMKKAVTTPLDPPSLSLLSPLLVPHTCVTDKGPAASFAARLSIPRWGNEPDQTHFNLSLVLSLPNLGRNCGHSVLDRNRGFPSQAASAARARRDRLSRSMERGRSTIQIFPRKKEKRRDRPPLETCQDECLNARSQPTALCPLPSALCPLPRLHSSVFTPPQKAGLRTGQAGRPQHKLRSTNRFSIPPFFAVSQIGGNKERNIARVGGGSDRQSLMLFYFFLPLLNAVPPPPSVEFEIPKFRGMENSRGG